MFFFSYYIFNAHDFSRSSHEYVQRRLRTRGACGESLPTRSRTRAATRAEQYRKLYWVRYTRIARGRRRRPRRRHRRIQPDISHEIINVWRPCDIMDYVSRVLLCGGNKM